MKKLILVSVVLLLAISAYADTSCDSSREKKNISLSIIIDTGPSNRQAWNMFQVAILEMAYQLNCGDKINIFTAHPGKPRLRISHVIGPEDKYGPSDIIRETTSFSREFLFGANLSRAVETVFEDFRREAKDYRCCLAVLSNGKIDNRQVAQIKRLAVAFKARDWPLRFICEKKQANRRLLVAGNDQQLDLRLLGKPELAAWINAARKPAVNVVRLATNSSKPIERAAEKSTQDSGTGKAKDSNGEPVKVEITNMPRLGKTLLGVKQENSKPVKTTKEKPLESKRQVDPGKSINKKRRQSGLWLLILAILSGISLVVGLGYWLKDSIFTNSFCRQIEDQIDSHEVFQQRLVGFVEDRRQDLGDIATLGEVIIGRGIGSSIFIDNENLEEKHVRIFRVGRKMKIQNLAPSSIFVDGAQLNRKQKTDLILPTEIELTGDVHISLICEPFNLVEDERGDTNEEKII
ncbi:FHA domain-containing protein [Planctomycetota bacterium]